MRYKSTRDATINISSSEAIINGISKEGGLYIPHSFPRVDLELLRGLSYQELALTIFSLYFDDYSKEALEACVVNAYNDKFSEKNIVKLKRFNNHSILELFHGKTLAFKDVALSILPHFMTHAAKKLGIEDDLVVLTATSGDTGKAALEGFCNVPQTKVVVFYPHEGISQIQKHQMITQTGDNTYVFGIDGNFDDAQSGVKAIFMDPVLRQSLAEKHVRLTSANSINIGRLIPQIVYYFKGYLEHVSHGDIKMGEDINVVVPTGNFGNILAARYAKEMGLPIKTLLCASNENHILTDFIQSGKYDLNRAFKVTNSPSMDILISSNLERYLSLIGVDVAEKMTELKNNNCYEISEAQKLNLSELYGNYATEVETLETISKVFEETKYVLDTHTAVAVAVYNKYKKESQDNTYTMIASTASPYKFPRSVAESLNIDLENQDDFALLEVLTKETGLLIPKPLEGLEVAGVKHPHVIDKRRLQSTIETILR